MPLKSRSSITKPIPINAKKTCISKFSTDILIFMLINLDCKQIAVLGQVSKEWGKLIDQDQVWRGVIKQYCKTNQLITTSNYKIFDAMNVNGLKILTRNSLIAKNLVVHPGKELQDKLALTKERIIANSEIPIMISTAPLCAFAFFVSKTAEKMTGKSEVCKLEESLKKIDKKNHLDLTIETTLEESQKLKS